MGVCPRPEAPTRFQIWRVYRFRHAPTVKIRAMLPTSGGGSRVPLLLAQSKGTAKSQIGGFKATWLPS